jgi:hypothetical protein
MFFSLLFSFLVTSVSLFAADREVQIEWEEQEGAKQYEIEITKPVTGESVKKQKFKTKDFSFYLPVGKFMIKCRPFDKRFVAGPWSEEFEIIVPPPPVEFNKLESHQLTASSKTLKATTALTWTSAEGIEQFRLKIFNEKDELVEEKLLKETSWNFEASPGKFRAELVALGGDGVENEEKSVLQWEVLGAQMEPLKIVDFDPQKPTQVAWTGAAEGAFFEGLLERQDIGSADPEEWDEIKSFTKQNAFFIEAKQPLKPGVYRLTVSASAEGFRSPPTAQREFIVKPPRRELGSVPEETESKFDFSKISN